MEALHRDEGIPEPMEVVGLTVFGEPTLEDFEVLGVNEGKVVIEFTTKDGYTKREYVELTKRQCMVLIHEIQAALWDFGLMEEEE